MDVKHPCLQQHCTCNRYNALRPTQAFGRPCCHFPQKVNPIPSDIPSCLHFCERQNRYDSIVHNLSSKDWSSDFSSPLNLIQSRTNTMTISKIALFFPCMENLICSVSQFKSTSQHWGRLVRVSVQPTNTLVLAPRHSSVVLFGPSKYPKDLFLLQS